MPRAAKSSSARWRICTRASIRGPSRDSGRFARCGMTVFTSQESDFDSLRLVDVSRTFGRRRALSKVSLTASAGTITSLLGPNGAGKSTLLSIAATLLRPTSGRVYFGDQDGSEGNAALRSRIGMLGHDLYLYAELSAA